MLKYIGIGAATFSSLAGGLYFTERSKYIKDTIEEAERDRQAASDQCFKIEQQIQKLKKEEANQQVALQDKMSTVEALWNERDKRILSETKRAADAIFITPEGYSVLSGITAHCNDSAQKFPYFYEAFDLNASKVHTIDMLLNTVFSSWYVNNNNNNNNNNNKTNFSLRDIAPALGMFRSDPFISSINLFLRADMKLRGNEVPSSAGKGRTPFPPKEVSGMDKDGNYIRSTTGPSSSPSASSTMNTTRNQDLVPSDVAELSHTFGRFMQHFQIVCSNSYELQQNVKRDSQLRKEKDSHNNSSNTNNDDQKTQQQEHPKELGFFVERVLPRVADASHLVTTAEADYLELQHQRELQKRKDIATSWNLYDNSDVFAAISYVTKTHDKIVTAASRGERWALDSRVAPAMKNLLVWSVAAEQYLAEMQTRDVLKDMTRCMSHSFVQINELPPEAQQQPGQQQTRH